MASIYVDILVRIEFLKELEYCYYQWKREDHSRKSPNYIIKMEAAFNEGRRLISELTLTPEFYAKWSAFNEHVANLDREMYN
jgi:hypothetical protein